jgi:hypothetical protein
MFHGRELVVALATMHAATKGQTDIGGGARTGQSKHVTK